MAIISKKSVNIVLTGENELLNRGAVVRGGDEEVYLLFDPQYFTLSSSPFEDLSPYFKFHRIPVDYNDELEIQRKIAEIAKPNERVKITVACEDAFGYGYGIAAISASKTASWLSTVKEVNVLLPRIKDNNVIETEDVLFPKISVPQRVLKMLKDVESGARIKREYYFKLKRDGLICYEHDSKTGEMTTKLTELGYLIKELL